VKTAIFCRIGHRKTEPSGYFCRKLTLTRTPDPIQPMRRGPDPNRLSNGKKQGGLWPIGVCLGSFGRTPPDTIGDSRTEFNRILCTSKSQAAVTSNKKTALYVEADYRQTRSIARPLCDSWASCCNITWYDADIFGATARYADLSEKELKFVEIPTWKLFLAACHWSNKSEGFRYPGSDINCLSEIEYLSTLGMSNHSTEIQL